MSCELTRRRQLGLAGCGRSWSRSRCAALLAFSARGRSRSISSTRCGGSNIAVMIPRASPRWRTASSAGARRGKLRNLEELLEAIPLPGATGIGHTRWATHGAPTEANAHPHATDEVAVVHNGIIENFRELREELIARGAAFKSDTDTEVIAHLITREMKAGNIRCSGLPRCRGCRALCPGRHLRTATTT